MSAYIGRVAARTEGRLGSLDLECPQLAGGHTLRSIPALTLDGSWSLPAVGDQVVILRMGEGTKQFRWTPLMVAKTPVEAKENRKVIYGPAGSPVLVLDADVPKVYVGDVTDTKPCARLDDETTSDSTTDSDFWNWLSGLIQVFSSWAPVPQDGGAALSTALGVYLAGNPVPTQMVGKVTSGSELVEVR